MCTLSPDLGRCLADPHFVRLPKHRGKGLGSGVAGVPCPGALLGVACYHTRLVSSGYCNEHCETLQIIANAVYKMLGRTYRIFTVSKGCVIVTAPQAAMPPAMKALRRGQRIHQ